MRGGSWSAMVFVMALFGAMPAHALSKKDPPPECPAGTSWREESDLERWRTPVDGLPGRVGWCQREDGVRHGPMRIWWDNGWLRAESTWVAGAETGPVKSFYRDGRPQLDTTHRDGRPEGRYTFWHPNGQRARAMTYEAGRPHGYAQYWDEAGHPSSQGAFVEGRKVGTWETYHNNGVLKEVARYEDGLLSGRQLVFTEGGLFAVGACWEKGEKRWESRVESEARTRACRPY